jgi:hypothetical protein
LENRKENFNVKKVDKQENLEDRKGSLSGTDLTKMLSDLEMKTSWISD